MGGFKPVMAPWPASGERASPVRGPGRCAMRWRTERPRAPGGRCLLRMAPSIPRPEIAGVDHLPEMPSRFAEQEHGGHAHRCRLEAERTPEREAVGRADREIGHPDFKLKWADLPPDVAGRNSRKDNVDHIGPEPSHANRKQQYPRHHTLGKRAATAKERHRQRDRNQQGGKLRRRELMISRTLNNLRLRASDDIEPG